jgi:hypothetical protein
MNRTFQAAAVLVAVMICTAVIADAQVCGPKDDFKLCVTQMYQKICKSPGNECSDDWRMQWMTLQAYCTTHGNTDLCTTFALYPASRLLFHHGAQHPRWESVGIVKRTKFDLNHIPTVSVGGRDHLIVAVDQTNPLLYKLDVEAATKDNIDQIAQLQTLVGLLGGNLAQLVKGRSQRAIPGALSGIVGDDLDAISSPVLDESVAVNCLLTATDARGREITGFIQSVESGGDVEFPLPAVIGGADCTGVKLTSTNAARAVTDLDQAVVGLRELSCADIGDLETALTGDPDKPDDIHKAFHKLATEAARCPFWNAPFQGGAASRLDVVRRELKKVVAALTPADMKLALSDPNVVKELDPVHRAALALAKTHDFEKLAALPKGIAALEDFDQTVRRFMIEGTQPCTADMSRQCIKTANIVNFLVVDGVNGDEVSWQDVETQPIKIATAGDFSSNIHARRQTGISTSYKVQPASARAWDVGVSLIRTRISDPKFTAVAGTGTQKVIAQTGATTRSGELALFANVRPVAFISPDAPAWTRGFGVEIGSALSTDKPAVFAGLSVQLGRYFRLGWGFTAQRVTELKGQKIGDAVTSNDDIVTHQAFHSAHYLSLTVSLGSIPFFSAPKN